MNPFKEDVFNKHWGDESKENKAAQEEVIKKNKPTLDQVVEFVADVSLGEKIVSKLYFIYKFLPISNDIGWFKKPDNDYGIGGFLKLDFYKKLLDATQFKNDLFPFLPGEIQDDEMLIDYLSSRPTKGTPSVSNYHGKQPKTSTLEWMIDNKINTIPNWKPEWWTPKLKTRVVKEEPFAIAYIPEDLLTKAEIKNYLKEYGKESAQYMTQFWSKIPESFKKDPEIFALWLSLSGGLREKYKNIYTEDYYTFEGVKKYFEIQKGNIFSSWKFVKTEWKEVCSYKLY